jgi:predicted metal-dependent peptidase
MWKEISKRIQVDLETISNTWGESAGDMMQTLAEINREKYDYAEFLRRFAILGENMEINDDEFDYIFYTYGLSLYKNMPLVEPLEYKEVKRVREFVIALDTSESVAGELVQKFVEKTWNILKQTENFFTRVNIHILQCGAKVEEDAKITSQEEFDSYMQRMVLRGFGGTDFRPVFEYVNGLVKRHEFRNFKGMIYFTDGYGSYPAMPPDYEAAFVFLDGGREIPNVPAWAVKVVLTQEQIELF